MTALLLAVSAGLSFGILLGYRTGKAVFLRVVGPYTRSRLPVVFAVVGGIAFIIPAAVFALFGARNLLAVSGGGLDQPSFGVLIGIAAGIALVVASGLVVAAFSGAVSAKFIANLRARSR